MAYASLMADASRGDVRAVDRRLARLLGLPVERSLSLSVAAAALPSQATLRYRGVKPAELAMARHAIKPVVKFEDLPETEVAGLLAALPRGLRVAVGGPYRKDGLLLRSAPCRRGDPDAMRVVYASRGDEGERLRRIEQSAPDDVRAAGELLGFPPCCVEAFAADVARSRDADDALNDDACLRVLATAPWNMPGDARLNPLSDLELLGFYPCTSRCSAAVAFADRVLAALSEDEPALAASLPEALAADVLFYRIPFFALAAPARPPQGERPGDATLAHRLASEGWMKTAALHGNLFGQPRVAAVQRRAHAVLGHALAGAVAVRVTTEGPIGALELMQPDGAVRVAAPAPAAALRGTDLAGPVFVPLQARFTVDACVERRDP